MSGHSKWSSIKHKKAATDAKRGKLFTKLARAISVAAREGGGDPEGNPSLALAIDKARQNSMPKDNIQRAIDRGTGEGTDAAAIERIVYEGYGPGGAAILVEAMSDNRNRTGSEIRHAFDRSGGSLGEPNSVAWMFDKRGVIVVDAGKHSEDDLIIAIDAGAEDVVADEDEFRVLTEPATLTAVREALEAEGIDDRVGRCDDGAEYDRRGGGDRGQAARPSDGDARRPRRRRRGPRKLRHPRRRPRTGRRLAAQPGACLRCR